MLYLLSKKLNIKHSFAAYVFIFLNIYYYNDLPYCSMQYYTVCTALFLTELIPNIRTYRKCILVLASFLIHSLIHSFLPGFRSAGG